MTKEQLIAEEKELLKQLVANRDAQREMNALEFINKNGVNIGDTIEWMDGRNPLKGVVSKIEYSEVRPDHYMAYLLNSDGLIGKREKRIWHFDIKTIKVINKA